MRPELRLIGHQKVFNPGDFNEQAASPVIACDFYVNGAEDGTRVAGGYQIANVLNVDHHALGRRMSRHISSTNLALRHMRRVGRPAEDSVVVITHTDCDSILSSGIMSGHLQPDDTLGIAAIAADHTGETNDLADLLQGLGNIPKDHKPRDPLYFVEVVERYIRDGATSLDDLSKEGFDRRNAMRAAARDMVHSGRIKVDEHGLASLFLESRIDGELFRPFLPDAKVILLMYAQEDDPSRLCAKMRLGAAAPRGSTLNQLGMNEFDPDYGGRWNAGSNSRNKGIAMDPVAYAQHVRERIGRFSLAG